jgi:type II secretory pathway pseudopilin PulG
MYKEIQKTKLRALTLVEVVVYLALFGVLSLVIVQFFVRIYEYQKDLESKEDLYKALLFTNEHIAKSFEEYESVNAVSSIFSNDAGVLRLENSAEYIIYSTANLHLIANRDGVESHLTNSDIYVTKFFIEEIVYDSEVVGVDVEIDFIDSNNNNSLTLENYYQF